MELDRRQLKEFAKQLIRKNYWNMVLAGLVLALATGRITANYGTASHSEEIAEELFYVEALIALILMAAVIVFKLFVMNPLIYGGTSFFLKNIDGDPEGTLMSGFRKENLKRSAFTLFLQDLMIMLFTLLFIIPGIIKAYQYYFVPQLLVDHPELSGKDILDLSKEMTNGRKKELFLLDLSFILWNIAAGMTWMISGIFYSLPYFYQTQALAYRDLVNQGCDPTRPA